MAYYYFTDKEIMVNNVETDHDKLTLGAYMGFAFNPNIELKGLYYMQDLGTTVAAGYDDSPAAWKVILDVNREALKYTGLWLGTDRWITTSSATLLPMLTWVPSRLPGQLANNNTTTMMLVRADQKWNDKWSNYLRYFMADFDTAGVDDATNWTVGIGYQMNPNVSFELAYDAIDYGTGVNNVRNGDDNIVRFRTYVTF